ncbi:MAG: hypothetical protein ACI4QV_01640, partial [Acutalibacteraceae bacterium]
IDFFNLKPEKSFFDKMYEQGYSCHAMFADGWYLHTFAKCFGEHTQIHFADIEQCVGPHFNTHKESIPYNSELIEKSFENIVEAFDNIEINGKTVIWFHMPHVIKGYPGYGSDIDFLDRVIGFLREKYGDDSIYLSADHGHANYTKGNICYGFHVYETEIAIPLITPRLENTAEVHELTSNIDIGKILTDGIIPRRDYIISDTAYYGQPKRRTAVVKGKFKYIYNKIDDSEELYDLEFDPSEERNLAKHILLDRDRGIQTVISDEYFYPYWDESDKALSQLREIKNGFYKSASKSELFRFYFKPYFFKRALKKIRRKIFKR